MRANIAGGSTFAIVVSDGNVNVTLLKEPSLFDAAAHKMTKSFYQTFNEKSATR